MDILVLFLILEEDLSAFCHYDVSCGLVMYGLYYVEVIKKGNAKDSSTAGSKLWDPPAVASFHTED